MSSVLLVALVSAVFVVALVSAVLVVSLMSQEHSTFLPPKVSTTSVLYSRVELGPSSARIRGTMLCSTASLAEKDLIP